MLHILLQKQREICQNKVLKISQQLDEAINEFYNDGVMQKAG